MRGSAHAYEPGLIVVNLESWDWPQHVREAVAVRWESGCATFHQTRVMDVRGTLAIVLKPISVRFDQLPRFFDTRCEVSIATEIG